MSGSLCNDIEGAWHRRAAFHHSSETTNCYRIFHGFTEGLSGLTIDRYDDAAIINHKVALPADPQDIATTLLNLFPFNLIVQKSHHSLDTYRAGQVTVLHGTHSDGVKKVCEDGCFYLADTLTLHSNGLYLDTRPLRRWLKSNAADSRVLNLFAHTGSLGIAARLGGAKEVVHLDKGKDALDRVQHNYMFNGLTPDNRGLLRGDIYFHLPRAIKWGQKFSGIILDPPPKVPPPPYAPKHRPEGQDFETLIALCCKLLESKSWLAAVCHDFRMSHIEFEEHIVHASNGRLSPIWRATSEEDFPESDPERRTRMTVFSMRTL
jgi:23S rRNA G2069 N7-methylase RlmK/C1962 C5-methylase RlmI